MRELLSAFSRREDEHVYVCYAREPWPGASGGRFAWRSIASQDPWWHVRTAMLVNRECDVFLSTNSYLTTWMLHVPAVPVIYDMIAFDREHAPNRRSAVIERLTLAPAVRRSRAFVAISTATADDLVARYPAAAGHVTVAPLGVSPEIFLEPSAAELAQLPPAGFVLAVGTLEPRKNLPRLVEAYRRLGYDLRGEHPLVVVGDLGWQVDETVTALRSLGSSCLTLGRVSDAILGELYKRCAVFCYPSLYEGFGLPVLEAMACGAAVITSSVSSLPEVGGEAVEYVQPLEVDSIASALTRVLESEAHARELGRAARERAAEFNWDRTAAIVLDVLEKAAA